MMTHALGTLPFWLSVAGIALAWFFYIVRPDLPAALRARSGVLVTILEEKYGLDRLYDFLFARGARNLGTALWRYGDVNLIDGLLVNGSARLVGVISAIVRRIQTGYIYHYAFGTLLGVLVILTIWLHRIFYPS
jgi:NADH-quinone oxidoreductase subunit L